MLTQPLCRFGMESAVDLLSVILGDGMQASEWRIFDLITVLRGCDSIQMHEEWQVVACALWNAFFSGRDACCLVMLEDLRIT